MNKLHVIAAQWHLEIMSDEDRQSFDIFKMLIAKCKNKIEYKIF